MCMCSGAYKDLTVKGFACMIMHLEALLSVPHSTCKSCLCDFDFTPAENSIIQLCSLFFQSVLLYISYESQGVKKCMPWGAAKTFVPVWIWELVGRQTRGEYSRGAVVTSRWPWKDEKLSICNCMQPTKWNYRQAPLDRNDYYCFDAERSTAAELLKMVTEMLNRREHWHMDSLLPLNASRLFLLCTLVWCPTFRYLDCWQRPCFGVQLSFFLRVKGEKKGLNWGEKGSIET